MPDYIDYQVISDKELELLFCTSNFGDSVNNSITEKRKLLAECAKNIGDKYWVGQTVFNLLLDSGMINVNKKGKANLTMRGDNFIEQELGEKK